MRYKAVNRLEDFEFHDSEWRFLSWDGDRLTVEVRELNIRGGLRENPGKQHMELAAARIEFEGFELIAYEPGVAWKKDKTGKSVPASPMIDYVGEEGREMLAEQLRRRTTIMYLEKTDDGIWTFGAVGEEPYYEARFRFNHATVAWDAFVGPAWYEKVW